MILTSLLIASMRGSRQTSEPMTRIRLKISYDGSRYHGWQKQAEGTLTIQGQLESTLSQLLNEPITTIGSGRTDAGVHALAQNVHFETTKDPKRYSWLKALNGMLPADISVRDAWIAPPEFHALYSARRKVYKYRIWNHPVPSPIQRQFSYWIPGNLSLDSLNLLAAGLIGTHDFASFQSAGTELKTTVRTLFKSQWVQRSPRILEYTVEGTGFLKQMVRNIVGTQLFLEKQGKGVEALIEILKTRDRQRAKDPAPPQGLFLNQVHYPRALDNTCVRL